MVITKEMILNKLDEFQRSLTDEDLMNQELNEKNRSDYLKRLNDLTNLKNVVLSVEGNQTKQYLLYILCNRAKLWRINKIDLMEMLHEVFINSIENDGLSCITESQVNSALKGFTDKRKLLNITIYNKTKLPYFGSPDFNIYTQNDLNSEIKAKSKDIERRRIEDYLIRYIRNNDRLLAEGKKGYTIDYVVQLLKKNGIKISKSSLYRDKTYSLLLQRLIDDSIVLRRNKGKDSFKVKLKPENI